MKKHQQDVEKGVRATSPTVCLLAEGKEKLRGGRRQDLAEGTGSAPVCPQCPQQPLDSRDRPGPPLAEMPIAFPQGRILHLAPSSELRDALNSSFP